MANLTPEKKAAAVIITMGADRASQIYKHLNESELEQLTYEIAQVSHLSTEDSEIALDDFYKMCLTQKVVTDGGIDYAKSVLEKAFGIQMASALLDRVSGSLKQRAFEFVRKADSKNLFALIQNERAQTIALILSYVRSDQAADVIAELPRAKRIKVVENIAKMDSASPDTIKIVEDILRKKFATVMSMDFAKVGGVDYIADVMNSMDRANEKFIFDELSKKDEALVDEIKNRMFVFEDIVLLDNMAIQQFLREVDQNDLVYALKNAKEDVANVIFANMSSRLAETVRSDLEYTYNVRLKDIEEAQQRIVSVIRRLENEGQLTISKGKDDEIIA